MAIGCAGAIKLGASFEEFMVRGAATLVSEMGGSLAGLQLTDDSPLALELIEARAYLAKLDAMSDEEALAEADAEYATQCANREAIQRNCTQDRQRYEAALAQLLNWNPEIEVFESLKSRLMDDITKSIQQDCCQCHEPPVRHMTALEWRIEKMFQQRLLIMRLEQRNNQSAVLQALRKSLNIEPNAPT